MSDKVAVICTIALVRALGLVADTLAISFDLDRAPCRDETGELVAELQKLGSMLD